MGIRCLIGVTLMLLASGGCSCRTTKEFDSGLGGGGRKPGALADHGLDGPGTAAKSTGQAAGGAGGGGQGSGKGGESGSASGGGAAAQGAGTSSGGAAGTSAANTGQPTGSADGGTQPVPGNEAGDTAGAADAPAVPAAALPGRPVAKPRYTAEQAVPVADAALIEAAKAQRRNDFGAAYDAALRAHEAVSPHAASSEPCRDLASRAGRLLKELAERQNRRFKPQPVETLFQ